VLLKSTTQLGLEWVFARFFIAGFKVGLPKNPKTTPCHPAEGNRLSYTVGAITITTATKTATVLQVNLC